MCMLKVIASYCGVYILGLLQNSRALKRALGSQLDEEDAANRTKEELYEIFRKQNLSFAIEPPPPSESGSGDAESGVKCYIVNTECVT